MTASEKQRVARGHHAYGGAQLVRVDVLEQEAAGSGAEVERVNAELKNWRILYKIRSCPIRASELVAAVQTIMIANA